MTAILCATGGYTGRHIDPVSPGRRCLWFGTGPPEMSIKENQQDPRAVDVSALCKNAGTLQGQWPLAGLQRLADSLCAASDGNVTWQAQGSLLPVTGGAAELWLELHARADVPLQCQRCLQTLVEALHVQRRFRFVRTDEEAARLDEESEDDVLVLQARQDLRELLEDELILALPIVPRHGVCPQPLTMPLQALEDEAPAPNPFAALAALRGRGPGAGG